MKILAVCGFGCGSSMILKMSLDKVCKQLDIDCEVEATDINSARGAACDAIFTSAELAQELKSSCNVPIYSVKKYMDLTEIREAFEKFLDGTNA
ncbi:PTS sugar transporter subunit IIB [Kineothrix sp. MB12-C1]|uniref:PTS sugar transporter subunit IIB n=1 Tax=Kineothrix sp. MB12-C1 TaxID=3070215 RepID=UPI0027D261CE|nr:PTS sugar transporter subunit IIB [Kineothrix sp. MB12-C1]WMC91579.1 PTS sugar transporter subunit IIB [Kineothrix sp. MB12-C1]